MLYAYKEGVVAFFVAAFGFGLFIMRRIGDDEHDHGLEFFSSFGIGSIALTIVAYVLILLAHFWPVLLRPGSILVFLFAIFLIVKEIGAYFIPVETTPADGKTAKISRLGLRDVLSIRLKYAWKIWSAGPSGSHAFRLILVSNTLSLLLVARLAFLKHILMPGYSDSPIHYQIVLGFLNPDAAGGSKLSLENIFGSYYHFGFHAITAWLASLTSLAPEAVISLLGQIFLVIAPLSIIFLTRVLTRDINGALFAGLLAAAGWLMPAFSVNWGKFPALASLAVMPAALALPWLYRDDMNKKPLKLFVTFLLLLGVILLHTRIVICILIAVSSFYLSEKLKIADKLGPLQSVIYALFYMVSLLPLSQLLDEFYRGLPVLVVFLILLPFAFHSYPKLSVGIFFYTFGLWLIVLAPSLVIKKFPALLDRQFIEIMLYIPFSLLAGAGFAGFMRVLPSQKLWRWLAVSMLLGGVVFNFMQGRTIYPNKCCDYVREGDRLAFQWIQNNASERTLFLISTIDDGRSVFGTDAGVWIDPFLGISTNKLPFGFDWESAEEIAKICSVDPAEIYIYMGGLPYSFVNSKLAYGQWTKPVFTAGKTIIYQVSGCSK
jgi:hypothetical protein